MCEQGWLGAGLSIFWVGESGWTFFMGGWGQVEVYFGWVGVGEHFYGQAGVGGGLFLVDGGVWTYLWVSRGRWGGVELCFG